MKDEPYGDDLLHHIAGDQDKYLVSDSSPKNPQPKVWLNSLVYRKFSGTSIDNRGLVIIEDSNEPQGSKLTVLWEDGTLTREFEVAVRKCKNGNTEEDRNLRSQILAKVVAGMVRYSNEKGD